MISALRKLRIRLRAREDSEHEQAILRIVIVFAVLIYMGLTYHPSSKGPGHGELLLLQGLAADVGFAILIFGHICLYPAANLHRRAVGMLSDAGAATFCMFLAGEAGVSMLGVYLFITFGNGFRYGRNYLFACQVLCLIGFAGVLAYAPYWGRHREAGWGLMTALIILPLYVSTLLKRIHEARARAEDANRAKSSFLANMSHEIRTPLNGIVGVADLLQTTSLNGEQSEMMRLLRHSVSVLRSLVDDVLDISKIEAGRLAIETVEFDLHATINALIRLLRPHALSKGLLLRALVDPAIDYNLRGDPHHLRQVLVNLISNAIKFTARGEIEVSCCLLAETTDSLRLRFAVKDTGIGISEDAQKRVFEQFVQADDSTTRRYGGTGLGTSIAKQLVELMGGVIGVNSTLNDGSTFWFEIPLLRASVPAHNESIVGSGREPRVEASILVSPEGAEDSLYSLMVSACGQVETVASANEVIPCLRMLRARGIGVATVAMTGDIVDACTVFENATREPSEFPIALMYVGSLQQGSMDALRLQRIEGAVSVRANADIRIFKNAIHAAVTREAKVGADVIELGAVLHQKRQPLRVLVAEDNSTNQAIIRHLLESAGHTVILAGDGEEALDRYEEDKADLALLDFNMPERNGIEVVTAIRTMEPRNVRLPIIILSASVTVEAREAARLAGADEFVGKPYEAANLLQVIDRLARRAIKTTRTGAANMNDSELAPVLLGALPMIDHARMRDVRRIASNPEFLVRLLQGFEDDVSRLLTELDQARSRGDSDEIKDITHAMRGAALSIGAQQLAARALTLETAAAANRTCELRGLAADVRRCFNATTRQLSQMQQKNSADLNTELTKSRSLP